MTHLFGKASNHPVVNLGSFFGVFKVRFGCKANPSLTSRRFWGLLSDTKAPCLKGIDPSKLPKAKLSAEDY